MADEEKNPLYELQQQAERVEQYEREEAERRRYAEAEWVLWRRE